MSAAFTPAPWFTGAQLEPLGGCLSRTVMATDTCITEVLYEDEDDATAEANARLIAAAPELYEALLSARDAIASVEPAEALGMVFVPPRGEDDFGHEYPVRDELLSIIDAALAKARGE